MDKLEGNVYKLRAFCFASFQKHQRYLVGIKINNMSGAVISGQCECKASILGRCSHVSTILFFLEKYCRDTGHSSIASTSKLKELGLGTKDKDPDSESTKKYKNLKTPKGYTREINVNDFVTHLQRSKESCIYQSVLKIQYDNFAVDEEYKNILRKKVEQFRDNMGNFLNGQLVFNNSVILRETIQGSEKWKIMRSNFFTSSLTKRMSSLVSDSAKTNFISRH
ncbi:hypothetical protein JTB14_002063 [Gonioctena quinquepunctata]|nr:hypothetical protein JTB14_002063 [Gonioctena quinquepunctata]